MNLARRHWADLAASREPPKSLGEEWHVDANGILRRTIWQQRDEITGAGRRCNMRSPQPPCLNDKIRLAALYSHLSSCHERCLFHQGKARISCCTKLNAGQMEGVVYLLGHEAESTKTCQIAQEKYHRNSQSQVSSVGVKHIKKTLSVYPSSWFFRETNSQQCFSQMKKTQNYKLNLTENVCETSVFFSTSQNCSSRSRAAGVKTRSSWNVAMTLWVTARICKRFGASFRL